MFHLTSRTRHLLLGLLLILPLVLTLPALPAGRLARDAWAGALSWTSLDGPSGGPAQAIAISPSFAHDGLVFAGGGRDYGRGSWAGKGIFRSDDRGLTWSSRSGPSNGAVFDVAFSANWASDGFALAGLWQGLWATTDAGASWHQMSSMETGGPWTVSSVAISPQFATDRTLLAGGSYGIIFRTTDAGATWATIGGPSSVRRVLFAPGAGAVALAASANGLWRTTDGGAIWSRVGDETQIFDVAFRPGHDTAYATFADRIWRSSDAGATWTAFSDLTASYLDQIAVSSDGAGLFVSAGPTLYRYDFGAAAFAALPVSLAGKHISRLAISPNFGADHTLLAGTIDGVWRSTDGGDSFARSQGFAPLTVYDLEPAPAYASSEELFVATELGVWRRSGGVWQPANAGITGALASSITDVAISPNYAADGTLFASQVSGISIGATLYRSRDRGGTWERIAGAAFISQIALSPGFAADRAGFMLADQRVLQSNDGGDAWTPQPFWDYAHTARLMALSPGFAANHTLYVAGSDFYRTTDGGANWSPALAPPPITETSVPRWMPLRLAVGPGGMGGDTLFLAIYRYETDPPYSRHDQLWRSTDGGQNWAIVAAAPDAPVSALALGSAYGAQPEIFLATYDDSPLDDRVFGPDVFSSADDGLTWRNLGALPNGSPPRSLAAPVGTSDMLLVGGEGAWRLAASTAPTATPPPCSELLVNRSFEHDYGWRIPQTAYPAARVSDRRYHGYFSMRTGIVEPADNRYSFSDFSQDVTVPATGEVTLSLWRWPQVQATAGESTRAAEALPPAGLDALLATTTLDEFYRVAETLAGDLQYGLVIAPPGGAIRFLYARLDDNRTWINEQFDLNAYRGLLVRLQFGTLNDGAGPIAAQHLDYLSVQVCRAAPTTIPSASATASPTGTATPTGTPTPTATLVATHTPTATRVLAPAGWLPIVVLRHQPPTRTATASPTGTASPSATASPTGMATGTGTPTATPSPTPTSRPTVTASPTATTPSFSFGDVFPVHLLAQPTEPESLYVLDNTGRLIVSTDGGASWRDLELARRFGKPGRTLGGDYTPPFTLWLGIGNELMYSDDAGNSWSAAGNYVPSVGVTVEFDNPHVLWSGGYLQDYWGVIRSADHGQTWGAAGVGLGDFRIMAANVLIDPHDRNVLFAYAWNSRGVPHLARGQPPGLWSPITAPIRGYPFPAPVSLGLAWHASESTLWAAGTGGVLLYSPNPKEMVGSDVRWEEAAVFGSGYFVQPLAWGSGPSLYVTLHRYDPPPAGGALLRTTDRGQSWSQVPLPR